MQEVKGGVLKSRLAFVEEHGGPEAVARVLGTLPPEDQAKLRALTLVGWYPFEVGKRLDEALGPELALMLPQPSWPPCDPAGPLTTLSAILPKASMTDAGLNVPVNPT